MKWIILGLIGIVILGGCFEEEKSSEVLVITNTETGAYVCTMGVDCRITNMNYKEPCKELKRKVIPDESWGDVRPTPFPEESLDENWSNEISIIKINPDYVFACAGIQKGDYCFDLNYLRGLKEALNEVD